MTGSDDLLDLDQARAALANPATAPDDLSLIAQHHPSLRSMVATHPGAHPGLLDWLDGLGDPEVSAAVRSRRPDVAPLPPVGVPDMAPPINLPPTAVAQPGLSAAAGPADAGPAPAAPPAPATAAPRRGRKLLVGAGVGVVALALVVSGVLTRGFGLLPSGGAATPEEAGIKVATKAAALWNSFSVKDLFNNPLALAASLNDELAPSEVRVTTLPATSSTNTNVAELFGITPDSINLLSDLAAAFHVDLANLKTEANQLSDDVAEVSYVDGTATVTMDEAKLRAVLAKAPATADQQLAATAAKFGLDFTPPGLTTRLPAGWVDEAVAAAKGRFPVTIKLADYARAVKDGSAATDPQLAELYRWLGSVVVVKEGGRWYLSSLLTGAELGKRSSGQPVDSAELKRSLAVKPAQHNTPTEAAEGLAQALSSGSKDGLLSELPLAERRYAAFTGILSSLSAPSESARPTTKFSELDRTGDRAKLRIDEFNPVFRSAASQWGIKDGSCMITNEQTQCLADLLNSDSVTEALSGLDDASWDGFAETTGIDPDDVIDKLNTAAQATVAAIKPDQLGLVAIKEDGGWHVSALATGVDLQSQLATAIVEGLKAAQRR